MQRRNQTFAAFLPIDKVIVGALSEVVWKHAGSFRCRTRRKSARQILSKSRKVENHVGHMNLETENLEPSGHTARRAQGSASCVGMTISTLAWFVPKWKVAVDRVAAKIVVVVSRKWLTWYTDDTDTICFEAQVTDWSTDTP